MMKTIAIILSIILYTSWATTAQEVQSIHSKSLEINFDKTIHLVFPDNIRYYDKGSEDILASTDETVPFLLKIKANNENFNQETNISVITSNGKFYSFAIKYSSNISGPTVVYVQNDSTITPAKIPICINKNVHLIFPSKIRYSDIGNEQLVSLEQTNALNVIKFKAGYDNIPETNLTIITEDSKIYNFILEYNPRPATFNYAIENTQRAMLGNSDERELFVIAQQAAEKPRSIYHLGLAKNKMEFYCSNILIKDNVLFLCFGIKNTSNINFNADFVKCFIRDIKRLKNTTIQETEMIPLIKYNYQEIVSSKKENLFVLAFNKFTIPDKKKFEIEIYDKDGGRHLHFRIDNNVIINAEKL